MATTVVGNETGEQAKRPILRPHVRSKYALPSERVPFETHFEVLRQFVVRTKHGAQAVGTADIEGGTIPKQSAALNVRFLTSIGLLKEDENVKNKYVPTPTAIKYVTTRNANPEKARPILRSVVEGSWFGQFATTWFSIHPATKESEFVQELAMEGEVSDMAKKQLALKTIVDYLDYAGIVGRDNDGNLFFGTAPTTVRPPPSAPAAAAPAPRDPRPQLTEAAAPEGGPADWHTVQTDDFYLKVRSDPDVFSDLREHIKLLENKMLRLRAKESGGKK